jgi:hypothetical protein
LCVGACVGRLLALTRIRSYSPMSACGSAGVGTYRPPVRSAHWGLADHAGNRPAATGASG